MGGGNSTMMIKNAINQTLTNNVNNYNEAVNKVATKTAENFVSRQASTTQNSQAGSTVDDNNIYNIGTGAKNIDLSQQIIQEATITSMANFTTNQTTKTNVTDELNKQIDNALKTENDQDAVMKAQNTLQTSKENDGGMSGMLRDLTDAATAMLGGGNTTQDIENEINSIITNNTINSNVIKSGISTSANKDVSALAESSCNVNQVGAIDREGDTFNINDYTENVDISQSIKQTAFGKCITDAYSLQDNMTGISNTETTNMSNVTEEINKLKEQMDTDNAEHYTDTQKNFLSSIMNGVVIIAIVCIVGGIAIVFLKALFSSAKKKKCQPGPDGKIPTDCPLDTSALDDMGKQLGKTLDSTIDKAGKLTDKAGELMNVGKGKGNNSNLLKQAEELMNFGKGKGKGNNTNLLKQAGNLAKFL